jgi:hypothetical protein
MDRRGPVTVFRVPRHDGTSADCFTEWTQSATVTMPMSGWLEISKNESMCARVSRRASLSWHVERFKETAQPREPDQHASLP